MFDLAFLMKMILCHDNKISYISEVCFKMKKGNNQKGKKNKNKQKKATTKHQECDLRGC